MKDHRRFREEEDNRRSNNSKSARKQHHQRRPQPKDDEEAIDLRLLKSCANADVDDILDLLEAPMATQ